MAEFCMECWNKINGTRESKWRYALSWRKDFCEECRQYKRVIIVEHLWSRTQKNLAEVIEMIRKEK